MKQHFKWAVVCLLLCSIHLYSQTNNNSLNEKIQATLLENASKLSLNKDDLGFKITSSHTSKKSKTQHIYVRQFFNGLEIVGTESSMHQTDTGKVVKSDFHFLNSLIKRVDSKNPNPLIDEYQAVQSAAAHLKFSSNEPLTIQSKRTNNQEKTIFKKGSFSKDDIPVQLVYINQDNKIILVWELTLHSISDSAEWYTVYVNAQNGEIVQKINLVLTCNFDSNPNHDHSKHSDHA